MKKPRRSLFSGVDSGEEEVRSAVATPGAGEAVGGAATLLELAASSALVGDGTTVGALCAAAKPEERRAVQATQTAIRAFIDDLEGKRTCDARDSAAHPLDRGDANECLSIAEEPSSDFLSGRR